MISIPLPFVVALLLSILAILLYLRREESTRSAFVFITLCAITTTIVGLRWTFDYPLFRMLQPIFAACIPVTAWYCFSSAYQRQKLSLWHLSPPMFFIVSSFTHPFWQPPLDPLLTLLYIGYGIALLHASLRLQHLPEQVRLTDIDKTLKAEKFAGLMLLMSAAIDSALALNFSFAEGSHTFTILAIGHALLLPMLAVSVIMVSLSIEPKTNETGNQNKPPTTIETEPKVKPNQTLSNNELKNIAHKIDHLLTTKEAFLDPDLTLNRLARKASIPARQISTAINHTYGRNISQVVNEYRVERAKKLLTSSDKNITQIYLDCGFHSKSNFNREFSRITNQTPSAFRRSALEHSQVNEIE